MAVNSKEGIFEKTKDFFTANPADWKYEKAGGDDRVPVSERTNDPKADAKKYARENGEEDPYPDYTPGGTDASGADHADSDF